MWFVTKSQIGQFIKLIVRMQKDVKNREVSIVYKK